MRFDGGEEYGEGGRGERGWSRRRSDQ